ncbi:MAG: sulfotransferase domain-containing protein [Alphaproteobacteria bacterium]|nr:sulfotransferase domain-containing protein [Alphaproteobacteria bacterium]
MGVRPTTLAGMRAALAGFETAEGFRKGLAFKPRPTDVFISPYSKCGTTWMQQIVHGLRSGGDMSFSEITEAVPWIEMAHDLGLDPEVQRFKPRAYKSHLSWFDIPKGGRYIVVFRDPADACLSLYKFFEGWFFETGSIRFEAFARDFYLGRGDDHGYWAHAASWWAQRDRDDVLLLCFEDLKDDLPGAVRTVARFLNLPESGPTFDIAVKQAGFDFMKAHGGQFDDHLVRARRDAACGLPPGGSASKVSKGVAGAAKPIMSDETRAAFDAEWRRRMGEPFGLKDYAAIRAMLN